MNVITEAEDPNAYFEILTGKSSLKDHLICPTDHVSRLNAQKRELLELRRGETSYFANKKLMTFDISLDYCTEISLRKEAIETFASSTLLPSYLPLATLLQLIAQSLFGLSNFERFPPYEQCNKCFSVMQNPHMRRHLTVCHHFNTLKLI